MALTKDEIQLIRESFRMVSQHSEQAADRFYRNLFDDAPETRHLFVNDMKTQGAMLMSKLGLVVAQLQNMDALAPMLEDLALRHVAYGVKPEHYPLVGTALVKMMGDMLGDDFTPEAKAAWLNAYNALEVLMVGTAYRE